MNFEMVRDLVALIDTLESVEMDKQLYLRGGVQIVDSQENVVAMVGLQGRDRHELITVVRD